MLLNLKHKQGFFYELCYFNFVMKFVFTWELQSLGEFNRSHSEFFRSYEQLILLTKFTKFTNSKSKDNNIHVNYLHKFCQKLIFFPIVFD